MNETSHQCEAVATRRLSAGIMSKGTESYRTILGQCSRQALEGDHLCRQHRAAQDKIIAALAARKAAR